MNRTQPSESHRGSGPWTLLLAVLAVCPPTCLSAQTFRTISDSVACVDCRIALQPVATLVGREADLGPVDHVAESTDGSFYTTVFYDDKVVFKYSRTGAFLKSIGRQGAGPGEFRHIISLRMVDDTLFVQDSRLSRTTLFFRDSLVATRAAPAGTWQAVQLSSRAIFNAVGSEGEGLGMPLHLMVGGEVKKSAGGVAGRFRRDELPFMLRVLAPEGTNLFWAAERVRYRIEHRDSALNLLSVVERIAPWFIPHQANGIYPDVHPKPLVRAIHVDDAGRLWVLLQVADSRWREAFKPGVTDDTAFDGRFDVYYDTILEVLDPRAQRVVARTRFDGYGCAFTTTGKVVICGSRNEVPYLAIYQPRMERRN